jgi:hypothetical protein
VSFLVLSLRWVDVDPATHAMDVDRVRRAVELGLGADLSRRAGRQRMDAVDRALLAEFGPWIAGWQWTCSDGGPVTGGAGDRLRRGVAADVAAVVAAVASWRERLEELARRFDALDARTRGLEPAEKAGFAASDLLPVVLEWTFAEDAWYRTFEVFLAWYLERELESAGRALAIAHAPVSGRFSSWIEPSEDLRAGLPDDVARLTRSALAAEPVDALAAWLAARSELQWRRQRLCDPPPVVRDGHEAYIRDVDAVRSAERAKRMTRALVATRVAAQKGRPLDFGLLAALQEIVLGRSPAFRKGEAFAHGGTERYGWEPDTRARFEAALAEANDDALPIVRAARVYLDICYFHPFEDGNARAARLALDHVLTSSGLALHAAGPVFLVARRALDRYGPYSFAYAIDYLAGPRSL